jgi:L-alanine-DL-glutamate epimerase-like enolase superfamily enzyme
MRTINRRTWLQMGAVAPAGFLLSRCARQTNRDIRIREVSFDYEDYLYRTPIKFGGTEVDRVTLLNVHCTVEGAGGKTARGFGSMPMGNVWSFPSRRLTYSQTLAAMKALTERINLITGEHAGGGHPLDLNRELEPSYLRAAEDLSQTLQLAEPIPKLCTLVTASPFDAAIHDAYGKLHGISSYQSLGPEYVRHDLSLDLGPEFEGEYLDRYILKSPKPRMPLYHLVGAVDPVTASDIRERINDGLPETLSEWIEYNGITHIKVKLNGEDLRWDVTRLLDVHRAASETQERRGVAEWVYSCDFNERCPNVDYLLSFLEQVREQAPGGFERIQYIEQPTARDLKADRGNVMHKAAELCPIVIDESLTDLETLLLAREMGYTGVALKACKGQSQALLMAAAAQKYELFLCVQDLTCPGASLIHSAGLAAHVPGVAAIEANARQYVPAANKEWESRFPGIFIVKDGEMRTDTIQGPGLGAVA